MKKRIGWILGILWLFWISTYFLVHIEVKGSQKIRLKLGEDYQEYGAVASFLGHNLSVHFKGQVDTNRVGTYTIVYKARNPLGIAREKRRVVEVYDALKPTIKLKGSLLVVVPLDATYVEPGYEAIDLVDGDLTSKVKVEGAIDTKKEGLYELVYHVQDSSGNEALVKRLVRVQAKILSYQADYDKIDNTKNGWWTDNQFDQVRPRGGADREQLKQYSAYFLGPDDQTIYLTFDEGSGDTYLDEIADLLAQHQVQATFFLCGHFMDEHREQVQKWVEQGHSIGNHTFHHRDTVSYANEAGFFEFQREITDMEELYQEITGQPMERLYRAPKGEWSYRTLKMVQDMGYRTYFWSADYLDFDQTYSKEHALEEMMKRYHNGAIYMLHPKQKGTYEALPSFIEKMRQLGYQFGLVKDISS